MLQKNIKSLIYNKKYRNNGLLKSSLMGVTVPVYEPGFIQQETFKQNTTMKLLSWIWYRFYLLLQF